MVLSLACAKEWLDEGPVIVCYSDIFLASEAIHNLAKSPHNLAMTYDTDWLSLWAARNEDVLDDAESFRLDGDRIIEIGNKAQVVKEIEGQYMGLFKLTPDSWGAIEALLDELPEDKVKQLSVTEIFQLLIERGYPIHGVEVNGQWGEIDIESDLLLYEKYAQEDHYGDWFYQHERKDAVTG